MKLSAPMRKQLTELDESEKMRSCGRSSRSRPPASAHSSFVRWLAWTYLVGELAFLTCKLGVPLRLFAHMPSVPALFRGKRADQLPRSVEPGLYGRAPLGWRPPGTNLPGRKFAALSRRACGGLSLASCRPPRASHSFVCSSHRFVASVAVSRGSGTAPQSST